MPDSDAECRCGKSGCLEAVADGGALAERLRHLNASTAGNVAQLAAEGDLQALHDRALPLATRSLRIEISALDEDAGTIGAIALAQQRILSPPGVAKLLDAHRLPSD